MLVNGPGRVILELLLEPGQEDLDTTGFPSHMGVALDVDPHSFL